MEKIKDIKNKFFIELDYFKKYNNIDINYLKSLFEKEYELFISNS